MDRPPLVPKKENTNTQFSICSPGPSKHPNCPHTTVSTPTPRKQSQSSCITNSPFREWAKSNLSIEQDSFASPGRGILSPFGHNPVKLTSPEIRVQVKEENPRVDTEDAGLQRTLDCQFVLSYDEFGQRDVSDEKALTPKKDVHAFEPPSLSSAAATDILQATPILRRLQIVDLLSFELVDGKVETHGFAVIPACTDSSFLRVRRQPSTVPPTPGFGITSTGDDYDSKIRICSCKKSRCLKLYCECFAASELCQGCKCMDCANDGEHETEREDAVERIKQRSINAFAPKIVEEMRQDKTMHARGCRCKKSHCLKKYCECYQAGVRCGDNCRCEECHNMPAAAASSSTPRERRSADAMRPLLEKTVLSPICRNELDRGSMATTVTPDEEDDDTESPTPRAKRPRMLDFNMAATPVHTSHGGSVLDQDSPDRRLEAYGHYNMFGSPSSLFLPN